MNKRFFLGAIIVSVVQLVTISSYAKPNGLRASAWHSPIFQYSKMEFIDGEQMFKVLNDTGAFCDSDLSDNPVFRNATALKMDLVSVYVFSPISTDPEARAVEATFSGGPGMSKEVSVTVSCHVPKK